MMYPKYLAQCKLAVICHTLADLNENFNILCLLLLVFNWIMLSASQFIEIGRNGNFINNKK